MPLLCHFFIVRVWVPRGDGLPHQCAHWFAMTPLFLRRRVIFALCVFGCTVGNMLACSAFSFLHCGRFRNGRARSLRRVVCSSCVSGCQGETDCHTSVSTGSQRHIYFTQPGHFYAVRVWVPRRDGLPHQCEHWFARTRLFLRSRVISHNS